MENLKLAIEKLLSLKIIKPNGCWGIPNLPEQNGYVRISVGHEHYSIHRLSACHFHGLDYEDKSKLALHKNECNNRTCWNPDHIYVGTYSDNFIDATKLGHGGGARGSKTHCPKGHEYTKANTYIYGGRKMCRECRKWKNQKHYYE